MGVLVTVNGITGSSPYNIYICQSGGTGCFYITGTTETSFSFDIPTPYDNQSSYMLKVVDAVGCVITGVTSVS
jgi:hypothetical protein